MTLKETQLLVDRGLPWDIENIPVYKKNFACGLSFTVSISSQHVSIYYVIKQTSSKLSIKLPISEDHTIARLIWLLKRARGAVIEETTHVLKKFSLSELSYFYA